jgi:hypothetical protein
MNDRSAGYPATMASVLPYLLAVLLVPAALAIMLFVVARIESEPPVTESGK